MTMMRSAGRPVRRYFNEHFEMVKQEVRLTAAAVAAAQPAHDLPERVSNAVASQISGHMAGQIKQIVEASRETQVFIARQLGEILGQVENLESADSRLAEQVARIADAMSGATASMLSQINDSFTLLRADLPSIWSPPIPQCLADVSQRDSNLLNKMNTHNGYRAQAGVWVNDALSCGFGQDGLELQDVNERIGEIPYVFSKLGQLQPPARVLDVGSCESTVALSLASLGYAATALDPRPYAFQHPRLSIVTSGVEDLSMDEPFDAVVLLSTIEHLGIGSYGLRKDNRQDLEAMRHIRGLLRPGGLLVLTTPFGMAKVDELERTYDVAGVHELIEGFELDGEPTVLVRRSRTEWNLDEAGFSDVTDDRLRVVMLSAYRPE